jgi:hypothetical protein
MEVWRVQMKTAILALAGLATLGGTPQGSEETVEPWQPPRFERPMDGKSEAERAEIRKRRSEQAQKRIRREAEMRILRMQLEDLLAEPTLDEKAVRAKATELEQLHVAAARERLEMRLEQRRQEGPMPSGEERMQRMHRGPGRGPHRRPRGGA